MQFIIHLTMQRWGEHCQTSCRRQVTRGNLPHNIAKSKRQTTLPATCEAIFYCKQKVLHKQVHLQLVSQWHGIAKLQKKLPWLTGPQGCKNHNTAKIQVWMQLDDWEITLYLFYGFWYWFRQRARVSYARHTAIAYNIKPANEKKNSLSHFPADKYPTNVAYSVSEHWILTIYSDYIV